MKQLRILFQILGVTSAIGFLLFGPASAAQLTTKGDCFVLEGPIAAGDFDLVKARFGIENDSNKRLCLNSLGGSYVEGVRIAKYLHDAGVPTRVSNGDTCLSACAIIFMGGAIQADDTVTPQRELHIRGKLGFHAPYLIVAEGRYNKSNVEIAYRTALVAISELARIARQIDFDLSLLTQMLMKGPNELYIVDTVGKAARHRINLVGSRVLNEYKSYAESDFIRACDNAFTVSLGSEHGLVDSYFSVREYTRAEFKKINENGRLRVEVSWYPPEATSSCVIESPDGDWRMYFREGSHDNPTRIRNVVFNPLYFFAPETRIQSLLLTP